MISTSRGSLNLFTTTIVTVATLVSFVPAWSFAANGKQQADNDNDKALFEKIFGNKKKAATATRAVIPVFIDGTPATQVTALFDTTGDLKKYQFEAAPLLVTLAEILDPPMLQKLQGSTTLTLKELESAGIDAQYDSNRLQLNLLVPAQSRKVNVHNINQIQLPDTGDIQKPATVSGYLNTRVGDDFNYGETSASNFSSGSQGRTPFRTDFEAALNVNNYVLEANGTYREKDVHPWKRQDVRLVKDLPEHMLRMSIGDLSFPVLGYQRFRPMAGITVARNFSLQPYRVTFPSGSFEFFLKSPSKVVIWTNNQRYQVLNLPAGRHDLRSLPLGNGINNIRLEITDDVGRTETLFFPYILESELLAPGLHQFAYSLGLPSTPSAAGKSYDTANTTYIASHRLGVSSWFTTGLFTQGDHYQNISGIQALATSRIGTFGFEPAYGRTYNTGLSGTALKLRYNYIDYGGPSSSQRTFGLILEKLSREFGTLGTLSPSNLSKYDLAASYSQQIGGLFTSSLSGTYQMNRREALQTSDAYSGSLSLIRTWRQTLQTTLTFSHRQNSAAIKENSLFALLSYVLPDGRQNITASVDTSTDVARTDWRYNSPYRVGGFNPAVGIEKNRNEWRADAAMDYAGNRGIAGVSHLAIRNRVTEKTSQMTGIKLGTAIAFADGAIGLSRPINDSFAMIVPNSVISGQTININPNNAEFSEASADWLGPAVLPNLPSYQYFGIHLDSSQLDPGYELGAENFRILPAYRSGFRINVGTDASVLLGGVLLDEKGKPIALQTAHASMVQDSKQTPILLFTNRKGKFRLEGFKPGKYKLNLDEPGWKTLTFTIPEGSSGFVDLGRLVLGHLHE